MLCPFGAPREVYTFGNGVSAPKKERSHAGHGERRNVLGCRGREKSRQRVDGACCATGIELRQSGNLRDVNRFSEEHCDVAGPIEFIER